MGLERARTALRPGRLSALGADLNAGKDPRTPPVMGSAPHHPFAFEKD
jgi:hypothetical protein